MPDSFASLKSETDWSIPALVDNTEQRVAFLPYVDQYESL